MGPGIQAAWTLNMPPIRKSLETSAKWAAVAIGFSVPISVALDNALLLVVFLLWFASGNLKQKYRIISENRVSLAALALIALLAIGMFYGKASFHEALNTLGKYVDLLFIPIFVTLLREEKSRRLALGAFVFAMMLTLFLSYLLKFGIIHGSTIINGVDTLDNPIIRGFPDNPFIFKLHITQNFFMAYGAIILSTWAIFEENRARRIVFGMLALLSAINVLFVVQGRTGYIVIAIYILYLFAKKFGRKGILIGAAAAFLLGSLAYTVSDSFKDRVHLAASEFLNWHPGKAAKGDNSIGERMEFYSNTLEIVKKHPFLGVGTGGFENAYAREVAGTKMLPTHNPHNEFLLIASQLGMAGLALMLLLFLAQWLEARKLPVIENHLAQALVLAMITGCLFNSFLLDHAEGLFFAFMTGVLFSARRDA
jgi:O-antigen ligase